MADSNKTLSTLKPGQVVGRCRIVRLLGRGGMGEVYLGEDLALQRPIALKVLPTHSLDPTKVERFLKEARLCSRIEHPNVVTIHDVGRQASFHYIVMQYVEGQNLSELLEVQGGPLPWRTALRVIRQAAKGLGAVHDQGLIHRDIKPSNIMLANDGRVLLMDFGLAREEAQSDLTQSGGIVGTPAFMSPEQCQGKLLDKRTDIYSLGGTLHYLMTGRLPFEGSVELVIAKIATGERPPAVHALNAFVPPEASRLVSRAMAPLPRERYPNVQEFIAEIGRVAKTPDLPSTASWGKSAGSEALVETNPASELAPLELITDEEPAPSRLKWQVWAALGVASVALLYAVGFGIRALVNPAQAVRNEANAPQTPASPAPSEPSRPAASSAARKPDKSRMVAIAAGMTTVGDSAERLRAHLQQIPLLAQNAEVLEQAVQQLSLFPPRQVPVQAFWIDKYEVTNEEYAQFVAEKGWEAPSDWVNQKPAAGTERFPVTKIRHKDAEAYATWAGKKLPTHAQWMRAFRGDQNVLFPWGDRFDATRANVAENPGFNGLSSVEATPNDRSQAGVFNLVGNASEYLRDRENILGKPAHLVKGANGHSQGIVNGISGAQTYVVDIDIADPFVGFRCVVEEP